MDPISEATVPLWLRDAVLGVLVFGVVAGMVSANLGTDRGPVALAYGWAFALGVSMLIRRRYPLIVLWATVFGLFGYYAADYPVIGLSVPAFAALLSAAQFRKPRWPVAAALVLLAVGYGIRVLEGQDVALLLGYELVNDVALMAAAIALGVSLRLRTYLQENSRRLVEATAQRERVQAQAAIASERIDIARELHDSLGHQSTVISMHADVAREALEGDHNAARAAMDVVKQTSAAMMSELRSTVKALRHRDDPRAPGDLASLQESLLDRLPIPVTASMDVPEALPRQVEAAAYRIIQEALTNVVKHSTAGSARVHITTTAGALNIAVTDPGPPAQPREPGVGSGAGSGVHGMRERAAGLGGTVSIEKTDDGGFSVRAALPLSQGHPGATDPGTAPGATSPGASPGTAAPGTTATKAGT